MSSYNMISWLWITMSVLITNPCIVSGDPRHRAGRRSRSCEARNVDNPCLNGGRCHVTLLAGEAADPALVTCRCPPAWTGATCELERDPCADGGAVCGPGWSCVRNSSNTAAGYDCGCGGRAGWRRLRAGLPRCVDVDECALLVPACFNGGRCHNRAGTYHCVCKPGFSGGRCELGAPPSPRSEDGWRAWSPWSRCEGPCGDGKQRRARICGRRRSGCSGEPEQSRTCVPRGCQGDGHRPWWGGDEDGTWRGDSVDQTVDKSYPGGRKTHRRKIKKSAARKSGRVRRKKESDALYDAALDSAMAKARRWRNTRKADSVARNWKLLHYLGLEPARIKRSLAQIESYDDLELALMNNEPRAARDLGKEEQSISVLSQFGEVHERVRRSQMQPYSVSPQSDLLLHKRSFDNTNETLVENQGSSETLNITMGVPGSNQTGQSFISSVAFKPNTNKRSLAVTKLNIESDTGLSHQTASSAAPSDSSLEETLRRPAAAVRALVGPAVGRARAALLRLRLTEAARGERQQQALAAAESAERQLRQARQEVSRRTAERQAAERRLWQLLDNTQEAARRGAQAQRAAKQQAARLETAESRLEAERRRRHQFRQEEAAAAARHSTLRAGLLRRLQAARQRAAAQSAALAAARRQADSAERRAGQAAAERRQQRHRLRQLETAERQKLAELQRQGTERLSAVLREAEREERRAQEAERAWKKAEHHTRPEPERRQKVQTDLRVNKQLTV